MFRMRRYRLFLLVALLAAATVYHLTQVRKWEVPNVNELKNNLGFKITDTTSTTSSSSSTSIPVSSLLGGGATSSTSTVATSPAVPNVIQASSDELSSSLTLSTSSPIPTQTPSSLKSRPIETAEDRLAVNPAAIEEFGQHGQGRLEIPSHDASLEQPFWKPQKEHFPIPSGSLITLPTGTPRQLPKIQHTFGSESYFAKSGRRQKQVTVKDAFKRAWSAYTKHAMPHDELSPVSGRFRDPFNGWGATLVDTLDTLWIMDLTEEFEAAVEVVSKINFTTSFRKDIPLFETAIRYLGGLVSAYDLTEGKYPVLLDQAVTLADVLMGAFDTPNRMPVTFYYWTPSYASQPHRAEPRAVLAELGSLSVEFTRLAQITKESKYYDAIARITNELEIWQSKTTLPGLWPIHVDASGCKKPKHSAFEDPSPKISQKQLTEASTSDLSDAGPGESRPLSGKSQTTNADLAAPEAKAPTYDLASPEKDATAQLWDKRQVDDAASTSGNEAAKGVSGLQSHPDSASDADLDTPGASIATTHKDSPMEVDCEAQGLASPPYATKNVYTIGGQADSAYEYLPKEHILLGGLTTQYQKIYENAMDVVRKKLLFRPMTKDGRDVRSVGIYHSIEESSTSTRGLKDKSRMEYAGAHLTCFAGGMFALGAKIFGLSADLDIAEKLTDGCVWAYESTTTGIMPETFELVPCNSLTSCEWNETQWWEALDDREKWEKEDLLSTPAKSYAKRQAADHAAAAPESEVPSKTISDGRALDDAPPEPLPIPPGPQAVFSHEEYVAARIREERLPPGFTNIDSRKYILRPEAIESVFIMYRITGDESWREKGWKMFTAIQSYTQTELANSAISDVTSEIPVFTDTMESFWLAETLKYFYLLYSEPSLISLDDYVFNTEAHPFKRPS